MKAKPPPRHYADSAVMDRDGRRWNRKPGTGYWLPENVKPGEPAVSTERLHAMLAPLFKIRESVDG